MLKQESYWTYKAGDIPDIEDLPEGTFAGTREQWVSLSPGMRREIYRSALRRLAKEGV